jgi:hypothetical protein
LWGAPVSTIVNPENRMSPSSSTISSAKDEASSRRRVYLHYAIAGVGGFLWTTVAINIASRWYEVMNWLFHGSVLAIDDQPSWGKVLQSVIGNSPLVIFFCLLAWAGWRRRQWMIPGLFFAGAVVSVSLILFSIHKEDRTSHLNDWPNFYRTEVSAHFKLPAEATIIHAEDYRPFPMGQEVRIRFRLPTTRKPAEWVKRIANSSGISDQYREDSLHYDGPGDYNLVSYDSSTMLYEVLYGWD